MMPVGPILLAVLIVLALTGFFDRILPLLKLSPRAGFLTAVAMLLGSLAEIPLGRGLSINLGTGVIPLLLSLRLLLTADEWFEPVRAVGAALATAAAVYLLWGWFPPHEPTELNLFYLDAHYIAGLLAGAFGYLVGKSRRASFAAGVIGVLAGDWAHFELIMGGFGALRLGGGGFHGTPLIAGVIALALADLVGEAVA